jgi:type VI secretion system protein ImpJ
MRTPQRPVWAEGMFLSPQHLQALDRYHEALLGARLGSIAPYAWGVESLDLDAAALGTGQLRVLRFAGVFPDGLALAFGENDAEAPPVRAIGDHFPPQARSVDVWLAIPRERDGVPAYAEEGIEAGPVRTRFTIATRPLQDATQPGATASVAWARPNAVVLLGAESREDHEAIKIAEVVRTPAGPYALADGYVPPVLRVGASTWLAGALRALLARLHAKQRELSEGRRSRDASSADLSGADVSRLLQMFALGGAIPFFAHVAEAGDAPPLAAHLALAQLAGQLAAFTPDPDVAGLPRFAYTDLRASFEPLLARLGAYLGGLAQEHYVRVPLEVRGALQIARVQDERLLRGQLVVAVKTDLPEQQVAEQLPRLCKIASLPDVQALVQAAAPGLPLQVLHRPPPEIPARAGVLHFALSAPPNDRLWKNVLADRTIALYLPPPFDPNRAKVELLAIPAPSAAPGRAGT